MKRFIEYLVSVVCALFLFTPALVQADSGWQIKSFDTVMTVQPDGLVDVKETILVNFDYSKHGIYRDIPLKYRNRFNQDISIGLSVIGVTDENGDDVPYDLQRDGVYRRIKIGDPNATITGEHTYVIEYQVNRALRYFDDHDELYWNVTGNDWEVPIEHASAQVVLPFTPDDQTQTTCFTGPRGSTAQDCLASRVENNITFRADDMLTIAVAWPKGLVAEPTVWQRVRWFLGDSYGVFLPFIAAAIGYYVWSRYGRDPQGKGIVRQYEAPDKTTPAELAYLVRQYFKPADISAEIVSLAEQGFLKIHEIKKDGWIKDSYDYELELVKDMSQASGHQRVILDAFFNEGGRTKRKISSLPDSFYKEVEKVRSSLWDSIKARGYFHGKPEFSWGVWVVGAVIVGGLPFYGLVAATSGRIDVIIGAIVAELVLIGFALYMPKRTEKGVQAYEYAMGFKQYIEGAETERVKWEEKQNLFFEVMPYAMVFGLADKWAKVFEGKLTQQPTWYVGTPGHVFSPTHFNSSMNAFSAATVSHSTPPSSSSSGFGGGGSSGGGGGGGGGGSW